MFYNRDADYVLEGLLPLGIKLGIDFSQGLLSDLAIAYIYFLNIAVKKLHARFDFPCWTLLEQRTPDANHYVAWQQPSLKIIHRALKVYQRDPRTTFPQGEIPFRQDVTGIHVGYDHGTNIWLKYMEPAPFYAFELWDATVSYVADGPVAYISSSQISPTRSLINTYRSLQNSNLNHNPEVSPTWWQIVPFPESVADLTVRYAFAEALREDGQFDKAQAEENAVIQDAVTKIAAMINVPFDTITDQARPPSRYKPASPAFAFGGGK
jgi:hypothetical protein